MKDEFSEFWQLYPRKVGKLSAKLAWARALKHATAGEILDGLRALLPQLLLSETKYRPHPATWLNQGRWEDEIETPASRVRFGSAVPQRRETWNQHEGEVDL